MGSCLGHKHLIWFLIWIGLVIRFEVKTRLFVTSRHIEVKLEERRKKLFCLYNISVVLCEGKEICS